MTTKEPKKRVYYTNDFICFNKKSYSKFRKDTGSTLSYPAAKSIVEDVLKKSYEFVNKNGLPIDFGKLGYFTIGKRKNDKAKVPLWVKEDNKSVLKKYINRHTNGFIYQYVFRFGTGVPLKRSLSFKAYRVAARNLAKEIFKGNIPPI